MVLKKHTFKICAKLTVIEIVSWFDQCCLLITFKWLDNKFTTLIKYQNLLLNINLF